MNELSISEARTLVQLVTYHALLQRNDVRVLCSKEAADSLMLMTRHLADKYMKEVVAKDAV